MELSSSIHPLSQPSGRPAVARSLVLLWTLVAGLLCLLWASASHAQAITRSNRLTGNINYVVTGGSLRSTDNSDNLCSLASTNTQSLTGVPAGATIRAAYLYWGGSGPTPDNVVTLNNNSVTASRPFSTTWNAFSFFGGFANVTALVSGNGSYTFGNLTVTNTGTYCGAGTAKIVVSGWSLVVIYEHASEALRAINVFDGLSYFTGSQVSVIADGFRIPTAGIDGKMSVVTWDGDSTNSTPLNGFSEALSFNGNTLGSLSYDSVSHFTPGGANVTTYGTDLDTYDISSFVSPGQTSATSVYSSGNDMVLLTAKIVSVTSEPVVDLSITKSHTGSFAVNTNNSYSIVVTNQAGSQTTDFPIVVTDTLPTGLTFVSGTGSGWSCSASGQTVTCSNAGPLAAGNSLQPIVLTVAVGNSAFPSVTNTASVTTASFDPNAANNSASDLTTVLGPNLSTSAKVVADLNGGDANPGDTLRYTITLTETAGVTATNVSVTDPVPGNTDTLSVVSFPSGATNTSNTSTLNISNITVPASGSVTIVFDVRVTTGTSPGATIDNTATITPAAGIGATPAAPQVIVSLSQVPGNGTKQLYLINGAGLTRVRPAAQTTVTIDEAATSSWTLTQALQAPLTLATGNFPVQLYLTEAGNGSARTITVTLSNSALGIIDTAGPTSYTLSGTPSLVSVVLNTGITTAPVGSTFTLTIENNTTGSGNRQVLVHQPAGGTWSRVELNSASVINVDSINTYNATNPGGSITTSFNRGTTAYIRAVVSDPFGDFDITNSTITLIDTNNVAQVTNATMTAFADASAATKSYEYAYAVPSNAAAGNWRIEITAKEGDEIPGITDLGVGSFAVTIPLPTISVSKISEVLSDPFNGNINPKRIPNSIQRYTVTVTNSGPGAVDASTLVIADVVPTNTQLYVSTGSGDPVEFIDGSPISGLSYNYATNVTYSNQIGGGAPYNYLPTADANGFDINVTGLRIAPTGSMNAATSGNPNFSVRFRVQVK